MVTRMGEVKATEYHLLSVSQTDTGRRMLLLGFLRLHDQ